MNKLLGIWNLFFLKIRYQTHFRAHTSQIQGLNIVPQCLGESGFIRNVIWLGLEVIDFSIERIENVVTQVTNKHS